MSTKNNAIEYIDKLRGGPLTFGEMIHSLRMADEVSQVALAKKVGLSRAHLCDIEKGRRSVSAKIAVKFAKALGYVKEQFVAVALEDQLRRAGMKFKVKLEAA